MTKKLSVRADPRLDWQLRRETREAVRVAAPPPLPAHQTAGSREAMT
jgi:hypothetical protein